MNLTRGLTEHLADLTPPPPDLDLVTGRGRRMRRTRRALQGAAVLAVVAVLAGTAVVLRGGGDVVSEPLPVLSGGDPMDLSHGLRAYGDPGRVLVLGGRTVPADALEGLDTQAVATSYGVVYFRDGRPMLLQPDGTSRSLWSGPVDPSGDWRQTAMWDPITAVVAFTVRSEGEVTVVLRDLTEKGGMTLPVGCDSGVDCSDLTVDAVDSGTVFVHTGDGTFTWDYAAVPDRGLEPFAGPRTRVADARNKTLLYTGPRPTATLDGWAYVPGAIDALLTYDGWNVLSWSRDLASTKPGGATLHLDLPRSAQWFNVDTDGSILAATTGEPARFYDCEVPSGACDQIGELRITGGDPQFMGNDM